MVVTVGRGMGVLGECWQRVQTSGDKMKSSGVLMYSIVTTVNSTVTQTYKKRKRKTEQPYTCS